ncbi:MAG TPA: CBS domain-containing protein [Verrucomicrobiae bacterium]|nr:CBS domain-containing protein [Verrucomicrobiae bacterium]
MLAKDLMTETAVLVHRDMLITDLATLLREKRIGGVPVVDENNKIVGIVTVTDLFNVMNIVRKVGGKRNWFSNFMFSKKTMTVKEIYTRKMYSVLPDTPIEVVVGLMLDKNIHTIPVMNEDQTLLHGVIGRHDVTCAALGILPKGHPQAAASPEAKTPAK